MSLFWGGGGVAGLEGESRLPRENLIHSQRPEQPPLGGVSDHPPPQGRRTSSLFLSLPPPRSPGLAGPSFSPSPDPPPQGGAPGSLPAEFPGTRLRINSTLRLQFRCYSDRSAGGGGRGGGVAGRGLSARTLLRAAAAAAAAEAWAREVPPARLRADILRIAPSGLLQCPGSDSSWQRPSSRATRSPACPPARRPPAWEGAGCRAGRCARDRAHSTSVSVLPVSPCASGSPPRRLLSLLRLPLWLSDSAPLCLSRSPSAWYRGVPRLEHPYSFLRLGHTWPLISRLQLPGLWPPSFPPLEQALEFPFPALNSSGGLHQNSTNGEWIRASRGEFLQRLKQGDWTQGLRKSISSLCFGQVPPAKLNLWRR